MQNNTNKIPVTYENKKAEKQKVEYEKLWKVAFWGFDTRIGDITNKSTTLAEIQSRFSKDDLEYKEIDNRLKIFRFFQGSEIDRAKLGAKPKKLPKHWVQYQKINEDDTEEEIARKEFENKLVIEKRPEFMKHLYPKYMKEWKEFYSDFDKYCSIKFGKSISEITEDDLKNEQIAEMMNYYDKKNPLLETNGVMNRVSRYMVKSLKGVKKKACEIDNDLIYSKLHNENIAINDELLERMVEIYNQYTEFKKEKQLKSSEFSTYEQFYKHLRNYCLENISSDIKELANLAVEVCYKLNAKKDKGFCWDVFGGGIVENLIEKNGIASVPYLMEKGVEEGQNSTEKGVIEYLGEHYCIGELDLKNEFEWDDDLWIDIEDIESENTFDYSLELEGLEDVDF